jgi:hypothetical protein
MGLLLNRAKESTATTGTGAVTPSGLVVPYRTWAAAGAAAGNYYDYLIEDGTAWESGVTFYNGTTFTRPGPGVDPWFASSSGALINLSGSATIACVANNKTLVQGLFMPPPASIFSLESGDATQLVLADDADVGLTVNGNTLVAGPVHRIAYRTLTTPANNWALVARMVGHVNAQNYRGFGLYAHDSVGGRLIGINSEFSDQPAVVRCEHYAALNGANTDFLAAQATRSFHDWVKLEKIGTNITYSTSSDGKVWNDWATESATAWMANNPNRVGIGVWVLSGVTWQTKFSVPYFSLTGTAV